MTETDERLPELDLGLGVWIDGHARYYLMKTLRENDNVIVDTLGQERLIVYIDPVSGTPAAHLTKSTVRGWEDGTLVLESGERIINGYILDTNAERSPISRPEQQFARWYGFSYLHPKCEIFGYQN